MQDDIPRRITTSRMRHYLSWDVIFVSFAFMLDPFKIISHITCHVILFHAIPNQYCNKWNINNVLISKSVNLKFTKMWSMYRIVLWILYYRKKCLACAVSLNRNITRRVFISTAKPDLVHNSEYSRRTTKAQKKCQLQRNSISVSFHRF